jgi:hypothetical protein
MALEEVAGHMSCDFMHCSIIVSGHAAVSLYFQEMNIKIEVEQKMFKISTLV